MILPSRELLNESGPVWRYFRRMTTRVLSTPANVRTTSPAAYQRAASCSPIRVARKPAMTAGSARARYATTKTAASSAARAVGAARPTRVRSTPSQAGPNPTPVTVVAAKNRSGELSAIAATSTTRPAPPRAGLRHHGHCRQRRDEARQREPIDKVKRIGRVLHEHRRSQRSDAEAQYRRGAVDE